ncbi:MAG: DUF3667 domain-containing protein [Burkholderiaceae bacterium]|nr:MAG: DUF3667 domain-containing protein [Burkholderiaceae bacterium]
MTLYRPSYRGYCINCDHPAPLRFCPSCGQKTKVETPSLFEFLHEYIHHFVALEGKLIGSLKNLIFHPGRLSQEYLCGRRQRYVSPLALYLTISLIFFSSLQFGVAHYDKVATHSNAPATEQIKTRTENSNTAVATGKDTVRTDRQRAAAAERASLLKILPLILFMLTPLYSWILASMYKNRQMLLGEHLVFMFHFNAGTLLITMLASILLSFHEFAGSLALLMLTVMTYQLLAMKGFYRGRWLQLLVRYFTFVAIYGISFFASFTLIVGIYLLRQQ